MANLITVTCPDHHNILVDGLWKAFTNKLLTDFAVDWNGRTVRAHRLILDIFLSPEKLEFSSPEGNIGDLTLLLEFMYSGKVELPRVQAEDTLGIARMLDFKLMVDALEGAMEPRGSSQKARGRKRSNPVDSLSLQDLKAVGGASKSEQCSAAVRNLEVDIPDDSTCKGAAVETVILAAANKLKSRRRPDSNLVTSKIDDSSLQVKANNSIHPMIGNSGSNPTTKYKLRSSSKHFKKSCQERLETKRPSSITTFECSTCKLPFPNKTRLARHRLLKHRKQRDPPQIFQCPHCEYIANCNLRLVGHVRSRHGKSSVDYFRCGKCNTVFLNRERYETHISNHRLYQCGHCPFNSEKKWIYENHLCREHQLSLNGKPKKMHPCEQCPYQAKNAALLRYHVAVRHSREKPYKCTIAGCSYAARSKKAVVHHVRFTHQDDMPFMCEVCSARLRSAAALEIHRRSHTGERPFPCTICERRFTTRSQLTKHIASHINAKPFLCHLCSYACNRRDNLRAHLKGKHKSDISSDELATL